MNATMDFAHGQVGYDIPALPGMHEADIQTPCLVLDLDALERNIVKMGRYAQEHGVRHRSHGKMHNVQKLQEKCAVRPTSVMSRAIPCQAVCDAGLEVQSLDSSLPVISHLQSWVRHE